MNNVECPLGEIWFGERTEQKLVNWLVENVEKDKPIMDIGEFNVAEPKKAKNSELNLVPP